MMLALTYGQQLMKKLPIPQLKRDQVLIRVKAASLNNIDLIQMKFLHKFNTKRIIGTDIAGVVIKRGKDVKNISLGENVFGLTNSSGAFAQYALIDQKNIAHKPSRLSFEEACTLPTPCGTALSAVQKIKSGHHLRILIDGSTGGVGLYVLQLAQRINAQITVTCSSHNASYMKKLGVNNIIPYDKQNITKGHTQFDVIIVVNGRNKIRNYRKILKSGGEAIFIGGLASNVIEAMLLGWIMRGKSQHISAASMIFLKGNWMKRLAKLVNDDVIHPYIDKIFSWHYFSEALTYKRQHHSRGQIVFKID